MALKRFLQRQIRPFAVMSEPIDLNVLQRPLEKASIRPQDPVTGASGADGVAASCDLANPLPSGAAQDVFVIGIMY